MKSRIMYNELKTYPSGHDDRGPARIGRVTFNRTGKTLQYRGKKLQRVARTPVPTTTMSRPKRVTEFLVPRETGKTDIPAVAAQSKLMKMFERNAGQKSGNNQEVQTRSLPDQPPAADLTVLGG